jgi:hypothetical protein
MTEYHDISVQTIREPPGVVFHHWNQAFLTGCSPNVNSPRCREQLERRWLICPYQAIAVVWRRGFMVVTFSCMRLSISFSNYHASAVAAHKLMLGDVHVTNLSLVTGPLRWIFNSAVTWAAAVSIFSKRSLSAYDSLSHFSSHCSSSLMFTYDSCMAT